MSIIDNLKKFLNLKTVKKDNQTKVYPDFVDDKNLKKFSTQNLESYFKRLYEWYISENLDSASSFKNRIDRYNDIQYAEINCPYLSLAMDMYADEAIQYDSQTQIINVLSNDKKAQKSIYDLLDRLGLLNPSKLRSIFRDLSAYGDAFLVHSIKDKEGIVSTELVDPRFIQDRIEFSLIDVANRSSNYLQYSSFINNNDKLRILSDILSSDKVTFQYANYFKKYLFGFVFSDGTVVPPWMVSHFRISSNQNEFYPFGKSYFINSISPVRNWLTARNLTVMARVSKFPIDIFKVKVGEKASQIDIWAALEEAKEEYNNITNDIGRKEDFGIGSSIWIPQELIEFDQKQSNIDVGDIADVEMLKDDVLLSTCIPKGVYSNSDSLFGQSAQSLLVQFKPFQRRIASLRSVFLEELSNLIRYHWLLTGEFDIETTKFELSVNFNMVEENSERLEAKNNAISFAKTILDNISEVMGISVEEIPVEIIKDIFSKYSSLDPMELNDWFKSLEKIKNAKKNSEDSEDKENDEEFLEEKNNKSKKIVEGIKHLLEEGVIDNIYFDSKQKLGLRETSFQGRHILSNYSLDGYFKYLNECFLRSSDRLFD